MLMPTCSIAQQESLFTQYRYNQSIINPAYATDDLGVVNIGGLYRAQWISVNGAPTTGTFFVHAPVTNNIELGINFINDQIGDGTVDENTITADFAYSINVNRKSKISFGLKAGANFLNTNFDNFILNDAIDAAFTNINQTFLNIGAGVFYFSDNYFVGLSTPNLLPNKHLDSTDAIEPLGVDEAHFFLSGGYVFAISDNVKLKPTVLARAVQGAPFSFDFTGSVLLHDKLELGVAYRVEDAVSGLVNFRITPTFRAGYAYDYNTNRLGNFSSGSHEIFLLFDLNLRGLSKGFEKSPRFF